MRLLPFRNKHNPKGNSLPTLRNIHHNLGNTDPNLGNSRPNLGNTLPNLGFLHNAKGNNHYHLRNNHAEIGNFHPNFRNTLHPKGFIYAKKGNTLKKNPKQLKNPIFNISCLINLTHKMLISNQNQTKKYYFPSNKRATVTAALFSYHKIGEIY